jgi:hypothetical protein
MGPGGWTTVLVPGKHLGFIQAPGNNDLLGLQFSQKAKAKSEKPRPPDLSLVTKPIDLRHIIAVRTAL